MSRILCLFDLYLDWFSFRLIKAEEKKVPLRPESDEVIARIMALPVDKRTYVKIFKIGMFPVLFDLSSFSGVLCDCAESPLSGVR